MKQGTSHKSDDFQDGQKLIEACERTDEMKSDEDEDKKDDKEDDRKEEDEEDEEEGDEDEY